MTLEEQVMFAIGMVGMVVVLIGMTIDYESQRVKRQNILSAGSFLLVLMSAYPKLHIAFFVLESIAGVVGLLNRKNGEEKVIKAVLIVGSIAGVTLTLGQGFALANWFATFGLIGIAIGYGSPAETDGGHQYKALTIGAIFMIMYSAIEIDAGIQQAIPFLILNIISACITGRDYAIFKWRPTP